MTSDQNQADDSAAGQAIAGQTPDGRVYVVGPNAMAVESAPGEPASGDVEDGTATGGAADGGEGQRSVTDLVEQPAKVMRIGNMIRQLLDEVKAAPLDDSSRQRLGRIYTASIDELKEGLAPELVKELERLSLPFSEGSTPSDAELRIAQAQLVGWLEGLFHGIQTALFAQQMAARAQLEQMRRALPSAPDHPQAPQPNSGGMYL